MSTTQGELMFDNTGAPILGEDGMQRRHPPTRPPINATLSSIIGNQTLNQSYTEAKQFFKLVPNFDGTPASFGTRAFIRYCEKARTSIPAISEKHVGLSLINECKGELAGQIFDAEIGTVDHLIKYIKTHFEVPTVPYTRRLVEFQKLKQNPQERVAAFGNRVTMILRTIIADITNSESIHKSAEERIVIQCAIDAFIAGLKPQYVRLLLEIKFEKLSSAIEAALNAEEKCATYPNLGIEENIASCYNIQGKDKDKTIQTIKQIVKLNFVTIFAAQDMIGMNKKGHLKAECRKRIYDEKNKNRGNNGNHNSNHNKINVNQQNDNNMGSDSSAIYVNSNQIIGNKAKYLVNTGSQLNLLKINMIKNPKLINKKITYEIHEVSAYDKPLTLGGIKLEVNKLQGTFHFVTQDFPLNYAGILGSEFMH
ncbi:hypothetical protein PV326_000643 [Microctonus aethiopoides]|nr:hypothetical protein PV326_000643 [Microctonus aethiopoides]